MALTQFQALDTAAGNYKTFDAKLVAAASVLGIQNLDTQASAVTSARAWQRPGAVQFTNPGRGHARAEWVLRWLVGKLALARASSLERVLQKPNLKGPKTEGHEARTSRLSWQFLLLLLRLVPLAGVARILGDGEILQSVRVALVESVEGRQQDMAFVDETEQQRDSTVPHKAEEKEVCLPLIADDAVLERPPEHWISAFVTEICALAEPAQGPHEIAREHLAAVLRVAPPLASELLGSWIRVCHVNMGPHIVANMTLNPFLSIWNSCAVGFEVEPVTIPFSENCLVPAFRLYSSFPDRFGIKVEPLFVKDELDQLLARHVVLPARDQFHAARMGSIILPDSWPTKLQTLLTPLLNAVDCYRRADDDEMLATSVFSILPDFFLLAVRNTLRTSTIQQNAEAIWLSAVLKILYRLVLGPNLSLSDSSDEISRCGSQYLSIVLETAKEHSIPIASEILIDILHDGVTSAHWELVLSVLQLDPGIIFLNQDPAESDVIPALRTSNLFKQLTALSKAPSGSVVPPENTSALDVTASEVVVHLMHNYTRYNRGAVFLDTWLSCIQERSIETVTIWEDESVIRNAHVLWTSIFPLSEQSSFLSRYNDHLRKFCNCVAQEPDPKNHHKLAQKAFASLVLVETILSSDNSITVDEWKATWKYICTLLEQDGLSTRWKSRLWRVVSKLHFEFSQLQQAQSTSFLQHCTDCCNSEWLLVAKKRLDSPEKYNPSGCEEEYHNSLVFLVLLQESCMAFDSLRKVAVDSSVTIEKAIFSYRRSILPSLKWCTALLTRHPQILLIVHEESMETLFESCLTSLQGFQKSVGEGANLLPALVGNTSGRRNALVWIKILLSGALDLDRLELLKFIRLDALTSAEKIKCTKLIQSRLSECTAAPQSETVVAYIAVLISNLLDCSPKHFCSNSGTIFRVAEVFSKGKPIGNVQSLSHRATVDMLECTFSALATSQSTTVTQFLKSYDQELEIIVSELDSKPEKSLHNILLVVHRALYAVNQGADCTEGLLGRVKQMTLDAYTSAKLSQVPEVHFAVKKAFSKIEDTVAQLTIDDSPTMVKDVPLKNTRLLFSATIGSSAEATALLCGYVENQTMLENLNMLDPVLDRIDNDTTKSDYEVVKKLKAVLPCLARHLQNTTVPVKVGLLLTGIIKILQLKSYMISQHAVDSILASLCFVMSSKSNLGGLAPTASTVYLSVCNIVRSLLVSYRKNLGGRMHILIPVLQLLLTNLFTLHTKANSNPPTALTPASWLSRHTPVLTATHALACSRILSTWVQPSVASVGMSRFTDETRRARQYAAEYVPYVLAHFAAAQLVGQMTPEVRKALLPGVWACIAAVPREALKGMNAGLGRDERAIWTTMWTEYEQNGKN